MGKYAAVCDKEATPQCPHIVIPIESVDTILESLPIPPNMSPAWFSSIDSMKKEVVVPTRVFPRGTNIEMLLHRVVHNATFAREYQVSHTRRGHRHNLVIEPWSGMLQGTRLLTTSVSIYVPFEATGRFISGQKFAVGRRGSSKVLLLHFSSETPDFPFCTTFRTETLVEFVEDSKQEVTGTVYLRASFHSWSTVEGIVKIRVRAETTEHLGVYMDWAQDICNRKGPSRKPMQRRKSLDNLAAAANRRGSLGSRKNSQAENLSQQEDSLVTKTLGSKHSSMEALEESEGEDDEESRSNTLPMTPSQDGAAPSQNKTQRGSHRAHTPVRKRTMSHDEFTMIMKARGLPSVPFVVCVCVCVTSLIALLCSFFYTL